MSNDFQDVIDPKVDDDDTPHGVTLGTVRLRHATTNEIILVPKPSDDPNDPLNWPLREKYYIFALSCFSIFTCNLTAAGPSAGGVAMTTAFFGVQPTDPDFLTYVGKVAYFFTGASLTIGIGQFIWTPVAIKYGRRPVYIICFTLLTVCCIWSGFAKSFGSELAARLLLGIAAGAPELVAPLTLTDIFFLHQRGRVMAIYNCCLGIGSSFGIIMFGLVMKSQPWQVIYWICAAMSAACTLIMAFTIPETAYNRSTAPVAPVPVAVPSTGHALGNVDPNTEDDKAACSQEVEKVAEHLPTVSPAAMAKRTPYFKRIAKWTIKTYTSEGILLLMFRPVALLALPGVLWATLVNSVTVGMIVVMSSNFATAFQTIYGWTPWQAGLSFVSHFIFSIVAIFFAGHFSDWVADRLTRRNGGVRIPEMRLPAIAVSVVIGPLGCILYGLGFGLHLHWMCPVIGIGLIAFTVVQSMNVSLVYILDSYRPVSGEVIVTQSTFKAFFGFLLGFYTNPWVQKDGYIGAFGAMGGIQAAVLLGFVPFYLFGSRWRTMSWKWPFIRRIAHWAEDREVGE